MSPAYGFKFAACPDCRIAADRQNDQKRFLGLEPYRCASGHEWVFDRQDRVMREAKEAVWQITFKCANSVISWVFFIDESEFLQSQGVTVGHPTAKTGEVDADEAG